ncbi:protein kinase activator [Moniliophthora roreri MCA 2997]|uniref:Protein kinase activator n=2 Tax=Moniliophthora roreri TaxID=221103 RepID=V2XLM7_MONRO|nr:protein kinase activator [Moniliophthora roreri MCA 2997]KAI3596798.1 protein kinase activator [Moniliophthora roreri]
MKSLRKSLNGHKDSVRNHISTPMPLPSVSKPNVAILPPQKVIKATAEYRSQAPQELSFKKGDFFYVLRDVDDQGSWYEAHNPVSGARGLVPRALFEEFNKSSSTRNSQSVSLGSAPFGSPNLSPTNAGVPPQQLKGPKSQVFYAIVLHDFEAERADELDAKRGDAITVVAQSNREWFVAKPIGRLGRPGLIPVSFVEIHDPTTGEVIPDVESLMDRGDLPRVEDWKRAMLNYKQNSITLGVIDSPTNRSSMPTSPYQQSMSSPLTPSPLSPSAEPIIAIEGPSPKTKQAHSPTDGSRTSTPDCLPEGILLFAEAVSFHYEMEEYWFRVNAVFQPYPAPGADLPPAKQLILFRVYNDFYDFQVALLNHFPREAGRESSHSRMLPYMPGPAQHVNDALTAIRRGELDEYLHALCNLNKSGAKYILESRVVREFLALKPGDVENETDPRVEEIEALFADEGANGYDNEVRDTLGKLKLDEERSEGSEYGEDEGYAPSPQRRTYDRHPYTRPEDERRPSDGSLRLQAHSQKHNRNGSTSSLQRTPSPYSPNSRTNSPLPDEYSPYSHQPPSRLSGQSRVVPTHNASSPSISSVRSAAPSTGRSRSHSNANTPSISAANPQTAFVKIKIFDRVADDLIAIRVHPRVTHSELMEKVQSRLGSEVSNLRYRDSVNNTFITLDNDSQLRMWMDGTDKHVLYAD